MLVVARGTFLIHSSKTTSITVKVLPLGRELVSHQPQVHATVRVVATGATKPISRIVTLH